VAPTDTVYGLIADATNPEAAKRVFKIKKRPAEKPLPVIVRNMEMAKKIAYFDTKIEKVLNSIWPGAVTVILGKKYNLPEIVTAQKRTVALRIPDYKIIHLLVERINKPLIATSCNISNQPPINKIDEMLAIFRKELYRPDLILDAGDLKFSEPSTVLDLTGAKPKIVRIGPVSPKKLMEILSL